MVTDAQISDLEAKAKETGGNKEEKRKLSDCSPGLQMVRSFVHSSSPFLLEDYPEWLSEFIRVGGC